MAGKKYNTNPTTMRKKKKMRPAMPAAASPAPVACERIVTSIASTPRLRDGNNRLGRYQR